MSIRMARLLGGAFDELRYEPTARRIRADVGGVTVVDSVRAVLVWEPRRVVPQYAVPAEDVEGGFAPAAGAEVPDLPVLGPVVPFAAHTAPGTPADVVLADRTLSGAGFVPADPDFAGYVVLDFAAFDGWRQEDEPNVSHPQDPFHRIDALPSSRHVRVERNGTVLAVSSRPVLLFETGLPTRYYLPVDDVRVPLVPSATRTWCAYKGEASYLSFDGGTDLVWTYPEPLAEAAAVRGLVAFFDERVDVVVDGVLADRPQSLWS